MGGDRELYVVAGMQLWGENRVTLEPTLTPDDVARLEQIRPSVIAMFGQTMDGVLDFWSSIPAANTPTLPECYDFATGPRTPRERLPGDPGHTCLTRSPERAVSRGRRIALEAGIAAAPSGS